MLVVAAEAAGVGLWMPLFAAAAAGVIGWLSGRRLERRRATGRALAAAEACARRLHDLAHAYREGSNNWNMPEQLWTQLFVRAEELQDHAAGERTLRRAWGWVLPALQELPIEDGHHSENATLCEVFAETLLKQIGDRVSAEAPAPLAEAVTNAKARVREVREQQAKAAEEQRRGAWARARSHQDSTARWLREEARSDRLSDLLRCWSAAPTDTPGSLGHLRGLAAGSEYLPSHQFQLVVAHACVVALRAGAPHKVTLALCRPDAYYLALPSALFLELEEWNGDEDIQSQLSDYVGRTAAHTLAGSRHVGTVLLAWSKIDRQAASKRVQEILSNAKDSEWLLSNLHQPDGFQFDAVVATTGKKAFDEAFLRLDALGRVGDELRRAWSAMDRAAEELDAKIDAGKGSVFASGHRHAASSPNGSSNTS